MFRQQIGMALGDVAFPLVRQLDLTPEKGAREALRHGPLLFAIPTAFLHG